ncbi:MAG TPA: MFS transporter [Jatrophihabitans sp.]
MTSPASHTNPALHEDPRRWKALGVLGLIQFMLILDITVVNVALPRIQDDLHFSESGLAWVVNGYVLAAGGLLLLGGRVADLFGRRRMFLIGVTVFALASALCGSAVAPGMLVVSRFVQGMGEAMAAPASLGLVALLFPDAKERAKALGIFGGIAGLGGVSGSVISGVLVDYVSWRWIFFINLPVAAFALLAVPRLVRESRMERDGAPRPDFFGAIIGTAGLVTIVDGLLNAATHPWGDWQVLLPLLGGVGLLGLMVVVEARSSSPLIPLEFFKNRTRVVTNGVTLFFSSGFFCYFFVMTLFLQQVLGYSPIKAGLCYVPFGVTIGVAIGVGTALMARIGVKALLGTGFLLSGVGLYLSSTISVSSSYAGHILPGMLVLAFGSGMAFPAIGNAALHQVDQQNSSLASGVQAAMQQVGGAIGLACLVTFGLRLAGHQMASGTRADVASTHGYVLTLHIGAILLAIGAVLVFLFLEHVAATHEGAEDLGEDLAEVASA